MTANVQVPAIRNIGSTGYESTDWLAAAPLLRAGSRPEDVNASASFLLDHVSRESELSLGELAARLSIRFGIPQSEALVGVATFAEIGQERGYLSYLDTPASRWRARARLVADLLRLPLRGTMHLPAVRRCHLPFSVATTIRLAAGRASLHGLLFGMALSLLAILLLGLDSTTARDLGVGLTLGLTLGQFMLGPAHEVAHAALSRALDRWPTSVYVQGLRVGLHRRRATPARDIAVILVGPLAATALGSAVVVACFSWQEAVPTTLSRGLVTGFAMATVFHATCLVPPAADGRALVRAVLRSRRSAVAEVPATPDGAARLQKGSPDARRA